MGEREGASPALSRQVGQLTVEDDEIEPVPFDPRQRLATGIRQADPVARQLQGGREQFGELRLPHDDPQGLPVPARERRPLTDAAVRRRGSHAPTLPSYLPDSSNTSHAGRRPVDAVQGNGTPNARDRAPARRQLTRGPAADPAHARHARHPAARRAGRALGLRDQAGRPARGGLPPRGRRRAAAGPVGRGHHGRVPGTGSARHRARHHARRARRGGPGPGRTGPRELPVAAVPHGSRPRTRAGGAAGGGGAGPSRAVRPAAPGGPLPAPAPLRTAPRGTGGPGPRRAVLVDTGRDRRPRRRGPARHP